MIGNGLLSNRLTESTGRVTADEEEDISDSLCICFCVASDRIGLFTEQDPGDVQKRSPAEDDRNRI